MTSLKDCHLPKQLKAPHTVSIYRRQYLGSTFRRGARRGFRSWIFEWIFTPKYYSPFFRLWRTHQVSNPSRIRLFLRKTQTKNPTQNPSQNPFFWTQKSIAKSVTATRKSHNSTQLRRLTNPQNKSRPKSVQLELDPNNRVSSKQEAENVS